jgi:hypothetical protein
MPGKVLMHNHSVLAKSFSDSDIQLFLNTGLKEIRAITPKYRYIMRREHRTRASWTDVKKAVRALDESAVQDLRKAYGSKFDASFRWHEIWRTIARDFGLVYRRELL